jgi:hypothetical protein
VASAKVKTDRDRREADLVLDVAVAHWAVNSAKDRDDRKTAHDGFKDAVRKLHEFVASQREEELELTDLRAGHVAT